MSRIVSLTAENFKRLKAVTITPDGNVVVVSGRNAQGKSSVLDAIWAALAGAAGAKQLDRPIRDGAERAEVQVVLDDLTVIRRWTAKGTTLTVKGTDGQAFARPQQVLDTLIGKIAFDPLAFAQAKPADQRATLLSVVDLPFDPDTLDAERKSAYDARTDYNRTVKYIEAQISALPDAPVVNGPVDVKSMADELATATARHGAVESLRRDLAQIDEEIARLQQQRETVASAGRQAAAAVASCRAIEDIQRDLAAADETNHGWRTHRDRVELQARLEQERANVAASTADIEAIDRRKADGLAAARMPVVGLGFDDEGVTLNGVPFSQASAAERLKVSVAMAMAANPTVRVICIRDAALLDRDSMAALERFAAARDFQIWVERVDPQEGVGVIIEDGEVLS